MNDPLKPTTPTDSIEWPPIGHLPVGWVTYARAQLEVVVDFDKESVSDLYGSSRTHLSTDLSGGVSLLRVNGFARAAAGSKSVARRLIPQLHRAAAR